MPLKDGIAVPGGIAMSCGLLGEGLLGGPEGEFNIDSAKLDNPLPGATVPPKALG